MTQIKDCRTCRWAKTVGDYLSETTLKCECPLPTMPRATFVLRELVKVKKVGDEGVFMIGEKWRIEIKDCPTWQAKTEGE